MMFGKYGPIRSSEEAFADGLASGMEWKDCDKYVPGGPWVCPRGHSREPDWIDYCAQSATNNREWLRGWHEGRRQRAAMEVTR